MAPIRILALLPLAAVLLAGCDSSGNSARPAAPGGTATGQALPSKPPTNGIDKLEPAEIFAKSRQAALRATSVRIRADLIEKGERIKFDLQLQGAAGGSGVLYVDGQPVQLLRIAKTVYLKASAQFWKASGAGSMSATLGKKYVKVPATDKDLATLAEFTDVRKVMEQFFEEEPPGAIGGRKGSEATIRGQRALPVEDSGSDGWVAYIALVGQPYPLQLKPKAAASDLQGYLEFLDYDKPIVLKAPPRSAVLDLSKLGA